MSSIEQFREYRWKYYVLHVRVCMMFVRSEYGTPVLAFFQRGSTGFRFSVSTPKSDRFHAALLSHDVAGEKLIAFAQTGVAGFILLLHLLAQLGSTSPAVNLWVVGALAGLAASSSLRIHLAHKQP